MAMDKESREGCVACGWTLEQQGQCLYSSHVKLFYGASKSDVWSIGSDVILKERPDEGPKTEVTTLKYFETAVPEIPAPRAVRDWVDSDGRYFVLTGRIPGKTLEQTWPSLSESLKTAIADQVVEVREQLQSHKSAQSSVSIGVLLTQGYSARTASHTGHSTPTRNSGMLSAKPFTIHQKSFPPKVSENLKERLPRCEPYVLTHCDLNLGNISEAFPTRR